MILSSEDRLKLQKTLDDFDKFRRNRLWKFKLYRKFKVPFKIVYFFAIPALVVSALLPFLLPFLSPILVIGLITGIIDFVLYNYVFKAPDDDFHHQFKTTIMPIAFEMINPKYQYLPYHMINEKRVKNMSLFKDAISRYTGEDYVSAKIHGVDVEICEAQLYAKKYSVGSVAKGIALSLLESDDARASKDVKFFSGLLMAVDFHKDFKGYVFALPSSYIDGGLIKKSQFKGQAKTDTGNTIFDESYSVFASNDVLLHYVLTPALLEKINQLNKEFKTEIFFSFINGRLNMGINWGKDLFECDFEKGISSIDDFVNLSKEIEIFENIVLGLSQERRIWGEKALS